MAREPLVIVVDACLSFRFARMLAGLYEQHPALTFRAMDDLHPPGTLDRDWLVRFPEDPPHVVITKDDKLLRETGQLKAWIAGGLTVVIFGSDFGNIVQEDMAATLLRWWPTILRSISAQPRRTAFAVPPTFRQIDRLPLHVPHVDRRQPRKVKTPEAHKPHETLGAKKRVSRKVLRRTPEGQLNLPLASRRKPRRSDGDAGGTAAGPNGADAAAGLDVEAMHDGAAPSSIGEQAQPDRPDQSDAP
ncbi:hypothetical protein KPL78_12360 [Roseomonas sp. HJA6]|uniref:VapC45 PIN like domain-containing protein n=1 Tax=Roseomonas alba TaxID=2846776 RepID=A0ABS7A8K8_9PROT|nr:hypothetical protein [Neoroseomonas alba]